MSAPIIRSVTLADAAAIAEIYSYYITESPATFELEPVTEETIAQRIVAAATDYPFLVMEDAYRLIGNSCIGPWKPRAAYLHTGETSIYLDPAHTGSGHGSRLYRELLTRAQDYDLHCLISGISLPNPASEALHRRVGFQPCGTMREVGFKFQRYIDVAYYQYILPGAE